MARRKNEFESGLSEQEQKKVKHCVAALKTADIIFDLVGQFKSISLEDHRGDCPNPLYQQTVEGLLLEFWGSKPVAVVTPWGKYSFCGPYDFTDTERSERLIWKRTSSELKARLGLILFKPKSEIKVDTIHGDLFAIGRGSCHEIRLPFPIERGYSCFESSKTARNEWQRLVAQIRESVPV